VPITLISEQERLCCTIGDARIYYRRIPSYVQQQIEAANTKRGVQDTRGMVEEVLRWAVLDWDGVLDAEGQPVPFRPELLKYLPEEAKGDLVAKLYASNPQGDLLGNSPNGSKPVQRFTGSIA
jgi:hypothetical protein